MAIDLKTLRIRISKKLDLVKFVMCTLVSRIHTYLQKGTQSLETKVNMTNLTRSVASGLL